jgi:two-component system sensor histidine kinase KdpD
VRHTPDGTPVEISAHDRGDKVEVAVADRGPGVRPGDEEKVFQKRYRGPTAGVGGYGLGLAICRAIVAAHGGRIWIEGRSGGGMVARFMLPVHGVRSVASVSPERSEQLAETR